MPILNSQLDADGHAFVDLVVYPALPRRRVLQTAGQHILSPTLIRGIIDPGAAVTVIDSQLRQTLNLAPHRIRRVALPNSAAPARVWSYKIDLGVIFPPGFVYMLGLMLAVLEMPLLQTGSEVLVGCDILSKCQFIHNGLAGTFSLAF
jgi:hypothetical protein